MLYSLYSSPHNVLIVIRVNVLRSNINYDLFYQLDNFTLYFYALKHCFDQQSLSVFSRPARHILMLCLTMELSCLAEVEMQGLIIVLLPVVPIIARHILHNTSLL